MTHPNESKLVDRLLDRTADPEIDRHLETCSLCREKTERLRKTSELLLSHEIPDLEPEAAEDLFAAAWAGARLERGAERSLYGLWRRGFQPAGLFAAGLFLGYLLFANPPGAPAPGVDTVPPTTGAQRESEPERNGSPADPGKLEGSKPKPPRTAENPDRFRESEYWEKAGFRNAKFTPTVRYEGNQKVWGARLEAETPGGALVVMNY